MRYAMAVDTKKCVGCSDCVVACQTENNVPIGYCRDWIIEVVDGSYLILHNTGYILLNNGGKFIL